MSCCFNGAVGLVLFLVLEQHCITCLSEVVEFEIPRVLLFVVNEKICY